MNDEERTFFALRKPGLQEMVRLMNEFHRSPYYMKRQGDAEDASREYLAEHGWDFVEYCVAIGTMSG